VWRALQLAIDIPALIEATVEGNGTILASSQIPASPAYDPDLAPVGYDLAEARRLLNEAGWKDINRDGFLECDSCLYAQPGSSFSLSLLYDSRVPSGLVDLLQWQFVRIGVSVYADPGSSNPTDQRYDMYLFTRIESYPVNPDQSILFTQAQDIISRGSNYGSYTNPQVEDLFEQARTTCDADEQADLYREAQVILQEDQPYLWLFVANDMVAVRGGVQGFEPYPNAPFWNMHEWSVTR
jgi:peptide/nickel transport system substrate-binding protein